MKKSLSLLIVLTLLMTTLAGTALAEGISGTFSGKGTGYGGSITVEVTLDQNTIVGLDVLEHNETPGIGTIALDTLPGKILEAQSVAVDTISGCTMASEGLIEAATYAIIASGTNVQDYLMMPRSLRTAPLRPS